MRKYTDNFIILFFASLTLVTGCSSDIEGDHLWQYSVFNNSSKDAVLIGYGEKNPTDIDYKYTIKAGQFQEVFSAYSGESNYDKDFFNVSKLEVYAGSDLKYTAYPEKNDTIFYGPSYTEVYRDDNKVISILPLFK